MEQKTCAHCHTSFTGTKRALFCSDKCRVYSHRGIKTESKTNDLALITEFCKKYEVAAAEIIDFLESSYSWNSKHILK